jgi:hypothetical protein
VAPVGAALLRLWNKAAHGRSGWTCRAALYQEIV